MVQVECGAVEDSGGLKREAVAGINQKKVVEVVTVEEED